MLASLKNRSQLTGTKYSKKDINNLGSGYFADALNASNTDRAWDLSSASQTLAEKAQAAQEAQNAASMALTGKQFDIQQAQNKSQFDITQATSADQFAKSLAEQKRIAEEQLNAAGSSSTLQNVGTGLSAAMTGAKFYDWMGGPKPEMPWSKGPVNPSADTALNALGETPPLQAEPVVNLGQSAETLAKAKEAAQPSVFQIDAPVTPEVAPTGTLGQAVPISEAATAAGEAAAAQLGGAPSYAASLGYGAPVLESSAPALTPAASLYAAPAAAGELGVSAAPALAGETLGSVVGPMGAAYALWDLGVTLGGGKSPTGAGVNQLIEQVPNIINQGGGQLSSMFGGGAQQMGKYGIYGDQAGVDEANRLMQARIAEKIAQDTARGEYTIDSSGQVIWTRAPGSPLQKAPEPFSFGF